MLAERVGEEMSYQFAQPSQVSTALSHPLNLITRVPPARPLSPPSQPAPPRQPWASVPQGPSPSGQLGTLPSHTHLCQPLLVRTGL